MTDRDVIAEANKAQAAAASPAVSAWVSASAGSGKTSVLTRRVLALLMAGSAPERILCLTFTKAAAAEMANRVADTLASWVTRDESKLATDIGQLLDRVPTAADIGRARRLFAGVLDAPGGLKIHTIHAFCQSLLKRFPLEAGVSPVFDLLDEADATEALEACWEAVVADAGHEGDVELKRALDQVVALVHETGFGSLIGTITSKRGTFERAVAPGLSVALASIDSALGLTSGATRESILAEACKNENVSVKDLRRAASALDKGSASDQERSRVIGDWLDDPRRRATQFEIYALAFLTAKGDMRATLATKGAIKADDAVLGLMQAEAARVAHIKDQLDSVETAANSKALLVLAHRILAAYRDVKARRSALDYDDLIAATRRLLERPGVGAWVLFKLDGGIDHVLIDEAQDTNPDQWAIIEALTSEFFVGHGRHEERADAPERTVFGVGDPKQSIFSFQGADPEGFMRMERRFESRVRSADRAWAPIKMNVSFRSTPAVLRIVDRVFVDPLARDGVVMAEDELVHLSSRAGHAGLVEVWPALEPESRDDEPTWKPPIERVRGESPDFRLARLVAGRIHRMISQGERLESEDRPIRAGDILVLVQRRTAFVEELIRRLKELGVGVAGADRMRLTEQIAVMDLMAFGRAMLLPEDDLNLATVLRSPLIGLDEIDLFALAHDRGPITLWRSLQIKSESTPLFAGVLSLLSDLMAMADQVSPFGLFDHVLVARDGRRRLLARLGPEADDPINEFLAAALKYQSDNPPSLQGFIHWLERAAPEIKRDLEQADVGAVRIMTCHGAKGLEAPVVFLPDTVRAPAARETVFWADVDGRPAMVWAAPNARRDSRTTRLRDAEQARQDREYRRLLYVAMTRARDRLYVAGWKTQKAPKEFCWHNLITAALGDDGATVRDDDLAASGAIVDGLVRRRVEAQSVTVTSSRQSASVLTVAPPPDWATRRPSPEPEPPRPLAPSRPARAEPPALSPVGEHRARRFQRGLVIHRLLQMLPDTPLADRRSTAARHVDQTLPELTDAARARVVDETLAVLDHPDFAPLFGPGSRAEVPVIGAIGHFRLSGQVDRLKVTDHEVLIVDYKTNRPPPRDVAGVDPAYVFQMAAYRAALARVWPDRPVRCVLLWSDGPFVTELPADMLDRAAAELTAAPIRAA